MIIVIVIISDESHPSPLGVCVCARVMPSKWHRRVKCIVLVGYGKEALVVDCHHVDVAPNKGAIALTVRAISGQ